MHLPHAYGLAVDRLNRVFDDTTNAYKFYWFLAILDAVKDGRRETIPMEDLALHMVANVWYPLDYYRLSFGKEAMDGFRKIQQFVTDRMTVNHAVNAPDLFVQLHDNLPAEDLDELTQMILRLLRYVPYRFIRPFFEMELRGIPDQQVRKEIVDLSSSKFHSEPHRVLYAFDERGGNIRLNSAWADYLLSHHAILRSFTLWHLTHYLQRYNPNVPGIPEKLFRNDGNRNLSDARKFWKPYLGEHPDFRCIYTNARLDHSTLSMDHFLPWSFVVHNQLWNLVPVSKSVNSSKSDLLPDWDRYFPEFVDHQYQIVCYHQTTGQHKRLEDYTMLHLNEPGIDRGQFRERLHNQLWPQYQIALNMGFGGPFVYRKGL